MRQPVDIVFAPVEACHAPYWRLVLRGCSQTCFQSNELTGALFLLAVLIASPIALGYMLVAATIAPGGRMLLGKRGAILTGLPGLNPCLIALSLPAFFHTGWTDVGMWGVLLAAVACTLVLTRVSVAVLPFPTLALPFLITFWALFELTPWLGVLRPIELGSAELEAIHPLSAVTMSLGQAIFSPTIASGLLFLAGLLLSNWRHGVLALVGAVIGTVVSYYHRDVVDIAGINHGLYGFNGVLTAVSVFIFCGGNLRLSVLGALVATMVMPVLAGWGIPTLSAPFVLTTWFMLALGWIEDHFFTASTAPALPSAASLKRDVSALTAHPQP